MEIDEQAAFWEFVVRKGLSARYPIYPVQNERPDVRQLGRLKKAGLVKGALDMNVDVARRGSHGLRIEFKYGYNKLSDEQVEMSEKLGREGFAVAVCYSAAEAIAELCWYLELSEFEQLKDARNRRLEREEKQKMKQVRQEDDTLHPDTITYDVLPEHVREGAKLYVERGIKPGSFMKAILANDFAGALLHADSVNSNRLHLFATWLNRRCPPEAWGSYEAVSKWLRAGGIHGRKNKKEEAEQSSAMVRGEEETKCEARGRVTRPARYKVASASTDKGTKGKH